MYLVDSRGRQGQNPITEGVSDTGSRENVTSMVRVFSFNLVGRVLCTHFIVAMSETLKTLLTSVGR